LELTLTEDELLNTEGGTLSELAVFTDGAGLCLPPDKRLDDLEFKSKVVTGVSSGIFSAILDCEEGLALRYPKL